MNKKILTIILSLGLIGGATLPTIASTTVNGQVSTMTYDLRPMEKKEHIAVPLNGARATTLVYHSIVDKEWTGLSKWLVKATSSSTNKETGNRFVIDYIYAELKMYNSGIYVNSAVDDQENASYAGTGLTVDSNSISQIRGYHTYKNAGFNDHTAAIKDL